MRDSWQDGFTLMEVMVAMVVLGFGLTAVVAATSQSARTLSAIQDLERLRATADHVMAAQLLEGRDYSQRKKGQRGEVSWIYLSEEDPDFTNLQRVKVTTYFTGRRESRRFDLESRQASLASINGESQ